MLASGMRAPMASRSGDLDRVTQLALGPEVDVVEECKAFLRAKREGGELLLPAGVSYTFAGSYENQLRAAPTSWSRWPSRPSAA
jgi:hypothetical protein